MDHPEFPPNSSKSKSKPQEDKDLTQVASGTRRRRSLRKQFKDTFVAGDARTATRYMMFEVVLPAARDMIVEAIHQGMEKLIFGESRRRATPPQAGPTGHINYTRYAPTSRIGGPQRAMSRMARARHDFDEIILDTRAEAEEVIDRLFEVVSQFEFASVADLYELVGLSSTHTDHRWGWTDLMGAGVSRVRGGYLLDLPEPEPLD